MTVNEEFKAKLKFKDNAEISWGDAIVFSNEIKEQSPHEIDEETIKIYKEELEQKIEVK